MIYFCADDYGISKESNNRIEQCLDGALNKISVLPNGVAGAASLVGRAKLSLHLNLVEGRALSNPSDIPLLVNENGTFRYSFIGLFALSLTPKRKELEKQLYQEIKAQITWWKKQVGQEEPICLDSHQHTHMIPLVFRTLMKVIREEEVKVESLRFPAEPLMPYLLTPSLYLSYRPVGLIKQWLLIILGWFNRREWKASGIPQGYFMGVLFSGQVTEGVLKKILPKYEKLAAKTGNDIEIGFHPGYLEENQAKDSLIEGCRSDFLHFYLSPWRKKEYDTLKSFSVNK